MRVTHCGSRLRIRRRRRTCRGSIRADLSRKGTPIGPYDVLIAGQALARDLTVVTNNVRKFARVEGLRLEDWMTV